MIDLLIGYCIVSILVGLSVGTLVAIDHWRVHTGQRPPAFDDKYLLLYAIAFIVGCPILNLVVLFRFIWVWIYR